MIKPGLGQADGFGDAGYRSIIIAFRYEQFQGLAVNFFSSIHNTYLPYGWFYVFYRLLSRKKS